jgi:hypothetical protein
MQIDSTRFYTARELSPMIGLGPKAITRECRRGNIRASKLTERRYLIEGQAAIDFLRSRETVPTSSPKKKKA